MPIQDDNDKCPGSEIGFHEWLEGRKTSPGSGSSPWIQTTPSVSTAGSSSLVLDDTVSVYRDRDLIREYDMIAIRQDARMYLQQGMTPEQVHRRLHDQGGLPHQLVERCWSRWGIAMTCERCGARGYPAVVQA